MRFQLALKTVLDFIWGTLGIIVKHPLFWLVLIFLMFWFIATSPSLPEPDVCPTCQQIVR